MRYLPFGTLQVAHSHRGGVVEDCPARGWRTQAYLRPQKVGIYSRSSFYFLKGAVGRLRVEILGTMKNRSLNEEAADCGFMPDAIQGIGLIYVHAVAWNKYSKNSQISGGQLSFIVILFRKSHTLLLLPNFLATDAERRTKAR